MKVVAKDLVEKTPVRALQPPPAAAKSLIKNDAVVDVCITHAEAEFVVRQLQQAGFDMTKLSIVGKNFHSEEHVTGYYSTGDRMKSWGKMGAFWGGVWGMLAGSAFFLIPGIGPVLIAGPLVAALVGVLERAAVVGGLSVLGAGLYSLGIPEDSIVTYETALKQDKFLVIAHGTSEELAKARGILGYRSDGLDAFRTI
ncbi:MAG: hypothetical protein NTX64_01255 [Elusimicrobia bacterium]|nr:hypothetical protein [Elusimicrobiota bacterium]